MISDNSHVIARILIYKLGKAKKANLLKAKERLSSDLSEVNDIFNAVIEICQEDKLKLTYSNAVLFAHLTNCQLEAYKWQAKLNSMADTRQNRKYVFDEFVFSMKSLSKGL